MALLIKENKIKENKRKAPNSYAAITKQGSEVFQNNQQAKLAKLVYAVDLGSALKRMQVQVLCFAFLLRHRISFSMHNKKGATPVQ